MAYKIKIGNKVKKVAYLNYYNHYDYLSFRKIQNIDLCYTYLQKKSLFNDRLFLRRAVKNGDANKLKNSRQLAKVETAIFLFKVKSYQ